MIKRKEKKNQLLTLFRLVCGAAASSPICWLRLAASLVCDLRLKGVSKICARFKIEINQLCLCQS